MRVLVIDSGFTFGGLAAIRALGDSGWYLGVGSPRRRGFAAASCHSRHWHFIPSPADDLNAFIEATNRAINENDYSIVIPAGDAELLALSSCRNQIRAEYPYPSHERVLNALDKLSLTEAALSVGLGVPETLEATNEAIERFAMPVVLKPRVHWIPGNEGAPCRLEAAVLSDRIEVVQRARDIRSHGGIPVVQEFIPGQLMGFTAVTDRSCQIVACVQQLAPLTWRPNVGMPARAFTVPVDQDLADKVAALLRKLEWFGLVQLQFICASGDEPRLIDFNGRPYASLALATKAGINFPDIWARLAVGQEVDKKAEQTAGVRYHWLEGDLKRSICQRNGGLLHDALSCIRYTRGTVGAIWANDDPGPVFRYPYYLLNKFL